MAAPELAREAALWARSATDGPLGQLPRKTPSETAQLLSKWGVSVEAEMPSVGRVTPVANINNPPLGHRFDVNHKVDAPVIDSVDKATAEDHLPASLLGADLARSETEWP